MQWGSMMIHKGQIPIPDEPEVATKKQKVLDGVVAVLEEQAEMVRRLKSTSDVEAESR